MDFKNIINKCITETKRKIKHSVRKDDLIIQATRTIDETSKVINNLTKRLRDWYAFYNPETEHNVKDNEQFVRVIISHNKRELHKKFHIKQGMGADLEKEDIGMITDFAKSINRLALFKKEQESYQSKLISEICPNINAIAGPKITAKLLELAGSLERLAKMSSSTIQLLGAEQALFRHLKTGAKPPKYGILHEHPLISRHKKESGKVARTLADKICTAAKVDFFKGRFIADKLKKEIEVKFSKW